jgi:hypothetical protein
MLGWLFVSEKQICIEHFLDIKRAGQQGSDFWFWHSHFFWYETVLFHFGVSESCGRPKSHHQLLFSPPRRSDSSNNLCESYKKIYFVIIFCLPLKLSGTTLARTFFFNIETCDKSELWFLCSCLVLLLSSEQSNYDCFSPLQWLFPQLDHFLKLYCQIFCCL